MKQLFPVFLLMIFQHCYSQQSSISDNQVEFDDFIAQLKSDFIYYEDKKEVIECVEEHYKPLVDTISHPFYKVLFYENVLNELYDSHVNLNTNTDQSYRLYSPIYVQEKDGRFSITSVFSSQVENVTHNILGAQVLSFNELDFQEAINQFPTNCHDKTDPEIREWLANKVLSGKRNEPRKLTLKLKNGENTALDLDDLIWKENDGLLTSYQKDNIGVIRINNSLGNSELVEAFDEALAGLMNTEALILDLRNTVDGGNTGVAEPIMGRFIFKESGYQVCESKTEKYTRTVAPRGEQYDQPLFVLVGRWTGSMGEGMAIGLDGVGRATVIGTEMRRLAGGMKTADFSNSNWGFRISIEKMYHVDSTLREKFVPEEYVDQRSSTEDEFLRRAFELSRN